MPKEFVFQVAGPRKKLRVTFGEVESGELVPAEKVFANLERKYSKDAGIQNRAYQSR